MAAERKKKRKSAVVVSPEPDNVPERLSKLMQAVLERTVYNKPLKKEMIIILQDLCKMYTPTGSEKPVIDYCWDKLSNAGFKVQTDKVNNLFAVRGGEDGSKLVCINAHTDTVQAYADRNVAETLEYRWFSDVMTGNGRMMGGDDRCGIAVALTLAMYTNLPMKIILTAGEEVGGTGSAELKKTDFDDVAFCFTIDRKGGDDIIWKYCGRTCAPKEFVDQFIALAHRTTGLIFSEADGSYADTYTICEFTPCVNLSAGYYNAHTKDDFVDINELYLVMMSVKAAIENMWELISAIDRAPVDWFKDIHAGDKNYSRGKYVDGVSYFYGTGWDNWGLGYGGYYKGEIWNDELGRFVPVKKQEPVTYNKPLTFQKTITPSETGKEKPKVSEEIAQKNLQDRAQIFKAFGKKCHIDYDNIVGRDDKTPEKTTIEEHEQYTMSMHEGVLLASYNDWKTSDERWDELLQAGDISPFVYRMGIEEHARQRKAREMLKSDIVPRLPEAHIPEKTVVKPNNEDPLNSFGDMYNDPGYTTGGEEEDPRRAPDQVLSWATKDAMEADALEELNEIGMNSGFLPGSNEYGIFVDFVTGNTTETELLYYVDHGLIDSMLYERALEARKEYEATLRLKQLQMTYEQEKEDEAEYERRARYQKNRKEKRAITMSRTFDHETKKHPVSPDVMALRGALDNYEKIQVTRFALGQITQQEWVRRWQIGDISDDLYRAGKNEQAFFKKHGKLSGRFTVDRDAEDVSDADDVREKYPTNYKYNYDETPTQKAARLREEMEREFQRGVNEGRAERKRQREEREGS
jgi:hypothetical protein